MPRDVVIIGAGIGGLAAAIRLAQHDCRVTVCEARDRPGGLASKHVVDGFLFDSGPYILLDRPGLEWAFRQLGLVLADRVELIRIPEVYRCEQVGGPAVAVFDSLERTADELDRQWPATGARYRQFIERMASTYTRLQGLQWISRPGIGQLVKTGAWRDVPFLFRSLRATLASAKLPRPVVEAIGVWTHVAGQSIDTAPSPLALVPALIHTRGAYYPSGGIGSLVDVLWQTAVAMGVVLQLKTPVKRICCQARRVTGIETNRGDYVPADAVISNVGLATYLELLPDAVTAIPATRRVALERLPLQSPGVCAYLAVKGPVRPPYLKFRLAPEPDGCRLLVTPCVVHPNIARDGWSPARLIAPMDHRRAESGGPREQRALLDRMLNEDWWRREFAAARVLATRIPCDWGHDFYLYRNSMNPVMTTKFMRAGRLPHCSPWIRGLYLAGSATHPGQWVSFCAVSGVLAANRLLDELEH